MHRQIYTVLGFALVAVFGNPATASLITFGNTAIDQLALAGPQTEGEFTYQATGLCWEIQTIYGNPDGALVTFFNYEGAVVGSRVNIVRSGGGLFTFNSVDFATIDNVNSDDVVIEGYLAGNLVGSLQITNSTPFPDTFQTIAGFLSSLDLLRVEIIGVHQNAMILDNFNLSPEPFQTVIPEPATASLLGVAALCCALRRRRRTSPRA